VTTAAAPLAPAIELIGIDKSFGPVHANSNVNLVVQRGVIHGIVGENGAGKSTLMSILYGFYEADRGEIRINGEPVRIRSSREAISHGIGMVHQHFMLVPPLSVLENVMLGAEGGPLLSRGAGAIRKRLGELGREYGLVVDPDALVGELSVGLQQRVEILKALVRGAEILVLSTHDVYVVQNWCTRVLWLDQGRIRADGAPDTVLESYLGHPVRRLETEKVV